MGTLRTLPSLIGLKPKSEPRTAFSRTSRTEGSQGWMTIRVGSGTPRVATWLIGRERPVVGDLDVLEDVDVRPSRPELAEFLAEMVRRDLHLLLEFLQDVLDHGDPSFPARPLRPPAPAPDAAQETFVPTFSPRTAFLMFPRSLRLKTTMGRSLSLQSEMAVVSMTRSPF